MAANTVPIRRPRTRRLRALASFGSALIAMTFAAGSASATIIERSRFTQPYEFDSWDCGYVMHVAGVQTHLFQVRADKKLDGNVFFTDNYEIRETWTAADGRWFTLSANGVFKDIKAKSLGGSLYEFTFHDVGQPIVITQRGRPAAVMVSVKAYEAAEHECLLLRLLAKGDREIAAGKGYDLDAMLAAADQLLARK